MLQMIVHMEYFHQNVVSAEVQNIQQAIARTEFFPQSVLNVEVPNILQVIVHMEYSLQNAPIVVVRITALPTVRRVCLEKELQHQDQKLLHHLQMKVAVQQ